MGKQKIEKATKTIKYIYATRVTWIGLFCVVSCSLIILGAMTRALFHYEAGEARAMVALLADDFARAAKDNNVELLEKELGKFSGLKFLSYAVILDAAGRKVALYEDGAHRGEMSYKKVPDLNGEEQKLTADGLYQSFKIGDYKLVTGIAFTAFGSFFFIYFVVFLGVLGAIFYAWHIFYQRVVGHLITVTDNITKIVNESDLTIAIPTVAASEVGKIALCFNLIIGKLTKMLQSLQEALHSLEAVQIMLKNTGGSLHDNALAIRSHIKDTSGIVNGLLVSFNDVSAELENLTNESARGSATVYEMSAVNEEVYQNVGAMGGAVNESTAAIEQMTKAIDKTAGHVAHLNENIATVNASIERLDVSIADEEKKSQEAIDLAKELMANAADGMTALKETIDGIGQIQANSRETAGVIDSLGRHAMNIGNILHVIDDITKQTGLLALNAAIISADAGEQGRGFAVVADEIGALASRTKSSTKEIAALIATIQSEAAKAIKVMKESSRAIEKGAKLGAEAQKAFDKLKESADKSNDKAVALAKATMEQAGDVRAVSMAIASITGMVEELNIAAGKQATEARALNEAAAKMSSINQQVAGSSEEQARSAGDVLKVIKNISDMAALVSERQKVQIASAEETLKAAAIVDSNAVSQESAAEKLTVIIADIAKQTAELEAFTKEFKI